MDWDDWEERARYRRGTSWEEGKEENKRNKHGWSSEDDIKEYYGEDKESGWT